MIGRAARCFGIDPTESELRKIEFVDKHIDRANRIILANPIFQAFREQRALPAIHPLNEAPHLILQQPNHLLRESHEARRFHTTWVTTGNALSEQIFPVFPRKLTYRRETAAQFERYCRDVAGAGCQLTAPARARAPIRAVCGPSGGRRWEGGTRRRVSPSSA